jgi:hypothetical protein
MEGSMYALVIGASAGIGKEIAVYLAELGYDLLLTARSRERLAEVQEEILRQYPARKILLLTELFDDETLDQFIGRSIDQDKMDIRSFKEMLREYVKVEIQPEETTMADRDGIIELPPAIYHQNDDPNLTRDCGYYENYAMTEAAHYDTETL